MCKYRASVFEVYCDELKQTVQKLEFFQTNSPIWHNVASCKIDLKINFWNIPSSSLKMYYSACIKVTKIF